MMLVDKFMHARTHTHPSKNPCSVCPDQGRGSEGLEGDQAQRAYGNRRLCHWNTHCFSQGTTDGSAVLCLQIFFFFCLYHNLQTILSRLFLCVYLIRKKNNTNQQRTLTDGVVSLPNIRYITFKYDPFPWCAKWSELVWVDHSHLLKLSCRWRKQLFCSVDLSFYFIVISYSPWAISFH